MTVLHDKLYKRTSDGSIQQWQQEVDGSKYRTVSGQVDGKLVATEWRSAFPKNVGKKNETTAEEQAQVEVLANYTKRLDLNYTRNINHVDQDFFFEPMLAKEYSKYPVKWGIQQVYSQPKLDGVRCVIKVNGAFSRKGKPIVTIPHILEALKPMFKSNIDLVLDGELYNHDFKDDFNEIISIVRQSKPTADDLAKSLALMQFHTYDMDGDGAFADRSFALRNLTNIHASPYIVLVPTTKVTDQAHLDELYGEYTVAGYEGQMVRISGDGYDRKRSKNLLKRKEFDENEYEIVSVEAGEGNRSKIAGSIRFLMPDGREVGAGVKGSFDYAAQLLLDRDKYVGGQVTIRHFKFTPDGIPRFPVAKALFPGKRDV